MLHRCFVAPLHPWFFRKKMTNTPEDASTGNMQKCPSLAVNFETKQEKEEKLQFFHYF